MLLDMLEVVGRFKFSNLLCFRIHNSNHAIIEIDLIVSVHKPHVVSHRLIGIAQNKVYISLILEDHVLEELESEFCELQVDLGHLQNLLSLLLSDAFAHPSGQTPNQMGCPSGNGFLDLLGKGPVLDNLFPNIQAHLIDHTQNVSFSRLRIRTQDEIRSSQGIKMKGMTMDIVGRIKKFPKLLSDPWRISLVNSVNGLTRGHVMGSGSDAADSGNDPGKFLHRSSQTEDLESSQFGDLKVSVFHIPLVVQKYLDLPVSF